MTNRPSVSQCLIAAALTAALAACASVPPGPPPDVVRLQAEIDRLHRDPRIAPNAGAELENADVAVDSLARDYRNLSAATLQQSVYVADRLVQIAEASARARYAEHRGMQLGVERERLLADANARSATIVAQSTTTRTWTERVPSDRSDLMAMQSQLPGMESRLDERGLVVRLGDFLFEPNRAVPTPTAEQSLDQLARVLRNEPATRISIVGVGATDERDIFLRRADAVRDYLEARGVEPARIDVRGVDSRYGGTYAGRSSGSTLDRRVDVVILAAR